MILYRVRKSPIGIDNLAVFSLVFEHVGGDHIWMASLAYLDPAFYCLWDVWYSAIIFWYWMQKFIFLSLMSMMLTDQ
mgnify:FL=1